MILECGYLNWTFQYWKKKIFLKRKKKISPVARFEPGYMAWHQLRQLRQPLYGDFNTITNVAVHWICRAVLVPTHKIRNVNVVCSVLNFKSDACTDCDDWDENRLHEFCMPILHANLNSIKICGTHSSPDHSVFTVWYNHKWNMSCGRQRWNARKKKQEIIQWNRDYLSL